MKKKDKTDPTLLKRAREMRREPTGPERRLWQRLRGRQLGGYKFRRQHPIGRFIVDFYCHEAGLIVEVDGDPHAFQEEYDATRTAWLEDQGFRVVRFSNRHVLSHLDNVLQAIFELCEQAPSL